MSVSEEFPIKVQKEVIESAIEGAKEWLLSRQDLDVNSKRYGAFHGEFIWHDGEAIRALLRVYKRKKETVLLERARLAADFILSLQFTDPANRRYYGSYETPAYTPRKQIAPSDIYELIPGIMEIYQETKEKKYLDSARLAGDWLLSHATCGRKGIMGQIFDAEKWEPIAPLPVHDEAGFLLLYEQTGDQKYLEVFQDQIDVLITHQDLLGTWWSHGWHWEKDFPSAGRTQYWLTYPILAHYRRFEENFVLPALVRSCDRLLRLQLWNGVIPAFQMTDGSSMTPFARIKGQGPFPPFREESNVDGTATAMATILWLGMYEITKDRNYYLASLRAMKWILDHQITHGPNKGAFLHSYKYEDNQWKEYLRDLSSIYGIMALEEYLSKRWE